MIEKLPNYDAWKTTNPADRCAPIEIDGQVAATIRVDTELFMPPHDDRSADDLVREHVHECLVGMADRLREYGITVELGVVEL